MISSLYILFFIFLLIEVLYSSKIISRKFTYFVYFSTIIPLIIFKDGTILPDHHTYLGNYDYIVSGYVNITIEISFYLISIIASTFKEFGFLLVLAIYGILHFYLIHVFIKKYNSLYYGFSILIYFSNFFIIFGLIQIRAGVALGFILYAVANLKKKKIFFISITLATFFHYSSFFFIFLILLPKLKITKLKVYFFLVLSFLFSKVILVSAKYLISLIPIIYIKDKLLTYTLSSRTSELAINLLNPFILSKIFLLIFFTINLERFKSDLFNLMFKLYFFGVIIYISFSMIPDMAVRFSNILFLSEIVLLPYLIYIIQPQKLVKVFLIVFAFLMLYVNINYTSYFKYDIL